MISFLFDLWLCTFCCTDFKFSEWYLVFDKRFNFSRCLATNIFHFIIIFNYVMTISLYKFLFCNGHLEEKISLRDGMTVYSRLKAPIYLSHQLAWSIAPTSSKRYSPSWSLRRWKVDLTQNCFSDGRNRSRRSYSLVGSLAYYTNSSKTALENRSSSSSEPSSNKCKRDPSTRLPPKPDTHCQRYLKACKIVNCTSDDMYFLAVCAIEGIAKKD